jgi:hypothetical protein
MRATQVEYSGTAHARAACINVVWDSVSMHDLQCDEGLHMVLVSPDNILGGASQIVHLLANRSVLLEMGRDNLSGTRPTVKVHNFQFSVSFSREALVHGTHRHRLRSFGRLLDSAQVTFESPCFRGAKQR